jgi:hypothetical protein
MWFVVRASDARAQVSEVAIEATDAAQARQRALKMRYLPLAGGLERTRRRCQGPG